MTKQKLQSIAQKYYSLLFFSNEIFFAMLIEISSRIFDGNPDGAVRPEFFFSSYFETSTGGRAQLEIQEMFNTNKNWFRGAVFQGRQPGLAKKNE